MNYPTNQQSAAAVGLANNFERHVDGGRIIIYCDHTDGAGRVLRFWLCWQPSIDAPSRYTAGGQCYLEKDGTWQEPHGAKFRRHFSTPLAAIRAAQTIAHP